MDGWMDGLMYGGMEAWKYEPMYVVPLEKIRKLCKRTP